MRSLLLFFVVASPVLAGACAGSSKNEEAASDAGGADGGAPAEDASAKPPIDPSLFDCTSLAKPPLPRRAATTAECLREPRCKDRFVVGHRGAGGSLGRIAPEDTLAAYRAAIALGVDIVETDPRPTADGVIVNVHDPTLDRTTTGTGDVAATTYADIQKLAIRADGFAGDFSCERVPTLKELLETCRGRAMVLVDANKTDRVEALVDAIRAADAVDWAVFDTDSTDKIDRALAIEPRLMIMPRAATIEEVVAKLAKYGGHVPVFFELDSKLHPAGAAEVHAAGSRVLTDVFVADLGVRTGADRRVYLDYYASGADALQSDLPDEVLAALGRRP